MFAVAMRCEEDHRKVGLVSYAGPWRLTEVLDVLLSILVPEELEKIEVPG